MKWIPVLVGLAVLAVAGCEQKAVLEGTRVEIVRVEGRRFEVRVGLGNAKRVPGC